MDVAFDFSSISSFFQELENEAIEAMNAVGKEAVEYAKENGSYRNRTGKLRASNKYEADSTGLAVKNTAEYASDVESRGYEVISGAALYAEKRLKEIFEDDVD